jgi:hypothetical protein
MNLFNYKKSCILRWNKYLLFYRIKRAMTFENTKEFARQLDSEDKLNKYRDEFIFPSEWKKSNLFHGNSLGLQPKRTKLMSMK